MPDRELPNWNLVTIWSELQKDLRMMYFPPIQIPVVSRPCDLWSRVKSVDNWSHHLHASSSSLSSLFFFDSTVRHRRILLLPPLPLLSIMDEHPNWVEYCKQRNEAGLFQVVYTFRNDAFREDTVRFGTNIRMDHWDHWDHWDHYGCSNFRRAHFEWMGPHSQEL